MAIEDFIKHGPHCLAGKYTVMGRCSCGAQDALIELAKLRKVAQQVIVADQKHWLCSCGRKHLSVYPGLKCQCGAVFGD